MPPKPVEPDSPDLSDQEWEDTNAYKKPPSKLMAKINALVNRSFQKYGDPDNLDKLTFRKVLLDLMHGSGQVYNFDMSKFEKMYD